MHTIQFFTFFTQFYVCKIHPCCYTYISHFQFLYNIPRGHLTHFTCLFSQWWISRWTLQIRLQYVIIFVYVPLGTCVKISLGNISRKWITGSLSMKKTLYIYIYILAKYYQLALQNGTPCFRPINQYIKSSYVLIAPPTHFTLLLWNDLIIFKICTVLITNELRSL